MTRLGQSTYPLLRRSYNYGVTTYRDGLAKPSVRLRVGTGESSDQATRCAEDIRMTSAHNSTNSLVFSTYDHNGTAYGDCKTKPSVSFHVGTGDSSNHANGCVEDIRVIRSRAWTGRRCPYS